MSGYSDDEITTVAAKFVRSDVKVQRDQLGPIDIEAKFDEARQLISSTLIFDPDAIFYLIYLATNQLNQSIVAIINWVDDLLQVVQEVSHHTKDVTKTSLLGDASAALLTVDSILTTDGAISSNALSRYVRAVDQFITASIAPNIKDQGEIIRPPQLARTEAITLLSNVSAAYEAALATLVQVRAMMDEFMELNLPVVAAQDSVRTTRLDVKDLQTYFEGTATRDAKIAACRDAFLRLTTGKSVLQRYTSINDPTLPRVPLSATRVGRAVVSDLVPASFTTGRSAPWEIIAGADELVIGIDGDPPVTITLVPPEQPSLTSAVTEPFTILPGGTLEIDSKIPIPLTPGFPSAATVAGDVNTWAAANYPGQYLGSVVSGKVKITKTIGGNQVLTITGGSALAALGFYLSQYDTSSAMSAVEVAAALNDDGQVSADAFFTPFESGTNGENTTLSTLRVPLNTIASLAHVGDQLVIVTGPNAGYHRIGSIVRTPPYDYINVTEPFTQLAAAQSWRIVREGVTVQSKAIDLTTELDVASGSANAVLGIAAATHYGLTSGFRAADGGLDVDFTSFDVTIHDLLYIGGDVFEVDSMVDQQLEVTPQLSTNVAGVPFSILSEAALAYEELVAQLNDWDEVLAASKYREDTSELDRVMNPLIANKNPSLSQRNDAQTELEAFRQLLTNTSPLGLSEILVAFEVPSSSRMDAALKMLQERGMDRAYDTLMEGKLAEFFAMDMDDVSNSAYMLKTMRAIAQHDLPISKETLDQDDNALYQSAEETDADFDYGDMDGDEITGALGNARSTEDDDSSKQRL